jgi:hypothetical protein
VRCSLFSCALITGAELPRCRGTPRDGGGQLTRALLQMRSAPSVSLWASAGRLLGHAAASRPRVAVPKPRHRVSYGRRRSCR